MKVLTSRKPYDEREDDERLESNWKKAKFQFSRKDWSASVVRVATATEIAANIYIRRFFTKNYELPELFVNSLLRSANGIDGKFKRLVKPAAEVRNEWKELKSIQKKIESINKHRNEVVHTGKFKSRANAKSVFKSGLEVIVALSPREGKKLELPFES